MDMEGALRARIVAAGTAAADRVYWLDRPQGSALPSITLQVISGDYPRTYSGLQSFRSPRVQMDVWATSYAQAKAIMADVVIALEPKDTSNGIYFDQIEFEGDRDTLERLDTMNVYRRGIDLIVWHSPA
jgi:hypothetical protein